MCAIASSSASCRKSAIAFVGSENCLVAQDCVAPLALIVNEALLNAVRHAHPSGVDGKIEISCIQNSGSRILIEVTDDGVGLPEDFDPARDGGHGLHLMRQLSAQLGATLSFESTCLGLTVQLLLPQQSADIGAGTNGAGATGTDDAEQLMRDLLRGRKADGVLGNDGRWRQLFQALPAAIYTTDAAGRITFYNEAAADLWGCRPVLGTSEFCGSWKLYWPDGTPLAHDECPMAMALEQKQPIRGVEAVAERPDGTRVPFIPYPTPLFADTGILVGAVNMLVDISERKHAEEMVARHRDEQSALYRFTDRLFRAGSLGDICDAALAAIGESLGCKRSSILLFDDTGVMRFVAWSGLSDAYRHAVEGHSPWTRETKDAQPICVDDIEVADISADLKATVKTEGIGALAFIPLVANGALIGKFMTYYDGPHSFSEGDINLSVTIARQLGFSIARLRAEQASRLLASIIETSDDAIISKNLDGIITSWNQGAERVFGYTADETVGRSILMLIPPDRHREEREIIARLRAGQRIEHFETVRQRKDGTLIDVSLTVSPVKDATDKVIGASKIARDISERKRSEAQRDLLFNEIKHRVKNTLATVQAIAGQTMRSASERELDSFVSRLHALGNAYDVLTSETWDRASMQDIVGRAIEPFQRARFLVQGPGVQLSADRSLKLTMVLHELATNAVKYGALSNASGSVSVAWQREDGNRLRLTWQETGGPPVAPPSHKGFGSTLIEHSLDGVSFEFAPTGVTCILNIDL